jgi:hypothetical protein
VKRVAAIILALGLLAGRASAAHNYPGVACYAGIKGGGWPLVNADGSVNMGEARAFAKFNLITVNLTPAFDLRPGLLDTLYMLNPSLKIVGYDVYGQSFFYATPGTIYKALWDAANRTVGGIEGLLYGTDGVLFAGVSTPWPNFGNATVATTLDSVWTNSVLAPAKGNGAFLDTYDALSSGLNSATGFHPDVARAGFGGNSAFDNARTAAVVTNAARLHAVPVRSGATPIVIGNGIVDTVTARANWDGIMFENWCNAISPIDNALNQYEHAGPYAWIASYPGTGGVPAVPLADDLTEYDAAHCKQMRFGLGCSCLGDGFASYTNQRDLPPSSTGRTYHEWYYDEYSVNAATANADTSGGHTGWMGTPVAAAYRDASGAWVRRFQHGLAIVNTTGSTATVNLVSTGRRWRKIKGVVNPTVNDGTTSTSVSVVSKDALFLVDFPTQAHHERKHVSQLLFTWVYGDAAALFAYTVLRDGVIVDMTNCTGVVLHLERQVDGSEKAYQTIDTNGGVDNGAIGLLTFGPFVTGITPSIPKPGGNGVPDLYEARISYLDPDSNITWTDPFRFAVAMHP